ncbi:MAG: pilus assembly protein PilM, partial [Victivallales bacterium]|nr:pilus assembly protein PilM [Victivallales bacterium]
MKKKADFRVVIDIGAASIKIAEFTYPTPNEMVLEKFIYEEYAGEADSNESRLPLLAEALKKILSENKFRTSKVFLSISSQTTFVRFIKLPPASKQETQVNQLVRFEAKQNIPYPIEEVTWDYQLLSPVDESTEEISVMIAVIKNDIINNFIKILEGNKLQAEFVDITPTTFFNAAKANRVGEEEPSLILNMGSFCSTLVFINQNQFYARTIPVAGNTITQQIMKELDVSHEEAENMKRNIGFVALGGAYEEVDSEVSTIVSKIIRNVMTRLHSEINRSINVYRSQQKSPPPKKLYLAGGSSIINFTERFLSTKLKMETEYFNPFSVVKISPSVDKNELANYAHMTAEVIGLGLRHITTCPIEISLLPRSITQKYFLIQKIPYITAACCTIILCLFTIYLGQYKTYTAYSKLLSLRKKVLSTKRQHLNKLKSAEKSLKNSQNKLNSYKSIIKDRNYWPLLLNNFEKYLPDNTWLVEFLPYSENT